MFFHIKNVLIDAKSGTEITDIGRKNWCPLVKILDPPLRPLVNLLKLVNSLSWGSVSAAPQNNVCPPTTCKTRKEKKEEKREKIVVRMRCRHCHVKMKACNTTTQSCLILVLQRGRTEGSGRFGRQSFCCGENPTSPQTTILFAANLTESWFFPFHPAGKSVIFTTIFLINDKIY